MCWLLISQCIPLRSDAPEMNRKLMELAMGLRGGGSC